MPTTLPATMFFSSPVKQNNLSSRSQTAYSTVSELKKNSILAEVALDDFRRGYLSAGSDTKVTWETGQEGFVEQINSTKSGSEETLYTGKAPLLRLLNTLSQEVFDTLGDQTLPTLVFRSCHRKHIQNPFAGSLKPDIVVLKETSVALQRLTTGDENTDFSCPTKTRWHHLVAVGEAKPNIGDGTPQVVKYLRNLLQLRPERNAVLGLNARSQGYRLFYHDANVVHCTPLFPWTSPGPLHTFVRRLYVDPFCDSTMTSLDTQEAVPTWAIQVGECTLAARLGKPELAPGQRRFIAVAVCLSTKTHWVVKDIWRDRRRRFFEGLLYEKAHGGKHLPGLMMAHHHGYVLDKNGEKISTSSLAQPGTIRYKMRVATQDVGLPLDQVDSLYHFLCVMYDVCAVQRNLFRKSNILHRDISDTNIMVVRDDDHEFYMRCADGYNEVKYINQLLAKDTKMKPRPTCLLIDLGNGADATTSGNNPEVLAERTGTPKFIARSISTGRLLALPVHNINETVIVPSLEGEALAMYQAVYSEQAYTQASSLLDSLEDPKQVPSDKPVVHQLFHEAESVFWVIAWVLARSASKSYQTEKEWSEELEMFVNGMEDHQPSLTDSRKTFMPDLIATGSNRWEKVLHSDLKGVANMLLQMSRYIYPEWAYRTDLTSHPEHVHEALMRLLLQEIVRIHCEKTDVDLAIGIRALPRRSTRSDHGSNSKSQRSISGLTGTGHKNNKRGISQVEDNSPATPEPPRQTPRLHSPGTSKSELDGWCEEISTKLKDLKWPGTVGVHGLEPPSGNVGEETI